MPERRIASLEIARQICCVGNLYALLSLLVLPMRIWNMNGLMLHCGANSIDRAGLCDLPLPKARGPRHFPVPFCDFADGVADALNYVGMRLVDERYGVTRDGNRFFGLMEVAPVVGDSKDFSMMMGLRGSHDQSISRGLVGGARVFVCDNLSFSGEVEIKTKQTTNILNRLPGLILEAVKQINGVFEVQERRFDTYKEFELKPRWGDAALTEMVRRGVLNPSRMGRAIEEWDHPSHEEHEENGYTLWRFHNAITEALKAPVDEKTGLPERAVAPLLMDRTVKMTQFLDEVCGFVH